MRCKDLNGAVCGADRSHSEDAAILCPAFDADDSARTDAEHTSGAGAPGLAHAPSLGGCPIVPEVFGRLSQLSLDRGMVDKEWIGEAFFFFEASTPGDDALLFCTGAGS